MTTFSPGDRVRVYAPHLRGEGEVLYHVPAGDRAPERYRVKLDASPRSKSIAARHLRPVERPAPPVNELVSRPDYTAAELEPIGKETVVRSPTYRAWVRELPCECCGKAGPNECSHHPEEGHGSTASKCSDLRTLSLCRSCHAGHHAGRNAFTSDRYWVERRIVRTLRRYFAEVMGIGEVA